MVSNVEIGRYEERVVHGAGTPEDFVLERDLWLYGRDCSKRDCPPKDLILTPDKIYSANALSVCQAYELRHQ